MCSVKVFFCVATLIYYHGYPVAASPCDFGDEQVFLNGCTRCACIKSGIWACKMSTDPTCDQPIVIRGKRDALPIKDLKSTPCAPTDSFVLDCNTCYCNGQGTGYLCTEKICPVNPPQAPTTIAEETTNPATVANASISNTSTSSTTSSTTSVGTTSTHSVPVSSSIPTPGQEQNTTERRTE